MAPPKVGKRQDGKVKRNVSSNGQGQREKPVRRVESLNDSFSSLKSDEPGPSPPLLKKQTSQGSTATLHLLSSEEQEVDFSESSSPISRGNGRRPSIAESLGKLVKRVKSSRSLQAQNGPPNSISMEPGFAAYKLDSDSESSFSLDGLINSDPLEEGSSKELTRSFKMPKRKPRSGGLDKRQHKSSSALLGPEGQLQPSRKANVPGKNAGPDSRAMAAIKAAGKNKENVAVDPTRSTPDSRAMAAIHKTGRQAKLADDVLRHFRRSLSSQDLCADASNAARDSMPHKDDSDEQGADEEEKFHERSSAGKSKRRKSRGSFAFLRSSKSSKKKNDSKDDRRATVASSDLQASIESINWDDDHSDAGEDEKPQSSNKEKRGNGNNSFPFLRGTKKSKECSEDRRATVASSDLQASIESINLDDNHSDAEDTQALLGEEKSHERRSSDKSKRRKSRGSFAFLRGSKSSKKNNGSKEDRRANLSSSDLQASIESINWDDDHSDAEDTQAMLGEEKEARSRRHSDKQKRSKFNNSFSFLRGSKSSKKGKDDRRATVSPSDLQASIESIDWDDDGSDSDNSSTNSTNKKPKPRSLAKSLSFGSLKRIISAKSADGVSKIEPGEQSKDDRSAKAPQSDPDKQTHPSPDSRALAAIMAAREQMGEPKAAHESETDAREAPARLAPDARAMAAIKAAGARKNKEKREHTAQERLTKNERVKPSDEAKCPAASLSRPKPVRRMKSAGSLRTLQPNEEAKKKLPAEALSRQTPIRRKKSEGSLRSRTKIEAATKNGRSQTRGGRNSPDDVPPASFSASFQDLWQSKSNDGEFTDDAMATSLTALFRDRSEHKVDTEDSAGDIHAASMALMFQNRMPKGSKEGSSRKLSNAGTLEAEVMKRVANRRQRSAKALLEGGIDSDDGSAQTTSARSTRSTHSSRSGRKKKKKRKSSRRRDATDGPQSVAQHDETSLELEATSHTDISHRPKGLSVAEIPPFQSTKRKSHRKAEFVLAEIPAFGGRRTLSSSMNERVYG